MSAAEILAYIDVDPSEWRVEHWCKIKSGKVVQACLLGLLSSWGPPTVVPVWTSRHDRDVGPFVRWDIICPTCGAEIRVGFHGWVRNSKRAGASRGEVWLERMRP